MKLPFVCAIVLLASACFAQNPAPLASGTHKVYVDVEPSLGVSIAEPDRLIHCLDGEPRIPEQRDVPAGSASPQR